MSVTALAVITECVIYALKADSPLLKGKVKGDSGRVATQLKMALLKQVLI